MGRRLKLIKKNFPNFEKDMKIYEDFWITCIHQENKIDNLSNQIDKLTKELSYTCPCSKFYIQRDYELKKLTAEKEKQEKIYKELKTVLFQSKENLSKKYFFIDFSADDGYDIIGTKREIKKGIKYHLKFENSGM